MSVYSLILSFLKSFKLWYASNPASPVVASPATKTLCPVFKALYVPKNLSERLLTFP